MRKVLLDEKPWEPCGVTFFGDPHTFKVPELTEQLHQDLKEAADRGDDIILWGDIHDWILPSDRKRYNSARDQGRVNGIVNQVVKELADFYAPFAKNIRVMKLGNHETAVIKYHHVDPMLLLVEKLNDKYGADIFYGGYSMWYLQRFIRTNNGKRNGSVSSKGWLHHGAGGSAPVTRGAIDRARIYDAIDADYTVIGHKHQHMHITTKHETLDDYGNVRRFDRDFLLLGGYSGWDSSGDDPQNDGHILSWSEESFYGLESNGCQRIVFTPKAGKPHPSVTRSIVSVSR